MKYLRDPGLSPRAFHRPKLQFDILLDDRQSFGNGDLDSLKRVPHNRLPHLPRASCKRSQKMRPSRRRLKETLM